MEEYEREEEIKADRKPRFKDLLEEELDSMENWEDFWG